MTPNVVAYIYVVIAIIATYLTCIKVFRNQKQIINRAALGWVSITLMLFLTPSVPLYFLGSVIILVVLAPKLAEDRFLLYFAMLPIIPLSANWRISLPGVETLLVLNHVKILSIVLLIPLLFQKFPMQNDHHEHILERVKSKTMFTLFFAFLLLAMLLDFREGNVTSAIRGAIELYLDKLILLFLLYKFCRSREAVDKVLFGMLLSGIFIAFVACLEFAKNWHLFEQVSSAFEQKYTIDFRGGRMRVSVMMGQIPFGFYMSICLVLAHYFSGLKKRGQVEYGGSILITCILLAGLFFSGSRGAWMVAGLMFGLIFVFEKQLRSVRGMVALFIIIAIMFYPTIIRYLAANDPYGTFQYRIDLFYNSIIALKDNIWLGKLYYREHPALQASVQGQGIIDMVNTYLIIVLRYGVPMLLLILFVIYKVIRNLSKIRKSAENSQEMRLLEWQARAVLAIIVGGFFLIITVSVVDRIENYIWVSLILGICVYRYGYGELRKEGESKQF